MRTQATIQAQIGEELANFQKSMDELRLMKKISKDLRLFRKLMSIKEFD